MAHRYRQGQDQLQPWAISAHDENSILESSVLLTFLMTHPVANLFLCDPDLDRSPLLLLYGLPSTFVPTLFLW